MNSRSLASSAGIHVAFFLALLGVAWIQAHFFPDRSFQEFTLLDGVGGGGGSGGGRGGKEGQKGDQPAAHLKQELKGQPVPKPLQNVAVPVKSGQIQKATKGPDTWTIKDKTAPVKTKPVEASVPVESGEKEKPAVSNVIRLGTSPQATTGEANFDFGSGEGGGGSGGGKGGGTGPGVGIGFGPGEGSGFGGFGSYLQTLRSMLWDEWSKSPLYGTNQSCVVALTVHRDGSVTEIKLDKSSGNAHYDDMALRAVRNASPLQPLPTDFPRDKQRFRIQFRLLE